MAEGFEHLKSVVHRRGPLTKLDYREAIKDLQRALIQDKVRHICCSICEDTGHTAENCHHNPLVLARWWSEATSVWCCYHCGYVARNDEEARAHFGKSELEPASCQRNEIIEQCAQAAEQQDRIGYEWVRDSLWDVILKRAGAAVRALKAAP